MVGSKCSDLFVFIRMGTFLAPFVENLLFPIAFPWQLCWKTLCLSVSLSLSLSLSHTHTHTHTETHIEWVYSFWILSILNMFYCYLIIFVLILHYFDYYSILVIPESSEFLFFKTILVILGPLNFHISFSSSLSYSIEKVFYFPNTLFFFSTVQHNVPVTHTFIHSFFS